MPQIETWSGLPAAVRDHLVERMHNRNISLRDLNLLRRCMDSKPDVPEGPWDKDFRSFQTVRRGPVSKDVPSTHERARGQKL